MATGLGVLFGKLQQGVQENAQVLLIARMRADAEDMYGQRMADIGPATDRISNGFGRDEGASVRKVGIQPLGQPLTRLTFNLSGI